MHSAKHLLCAPPISKIFKKETDPKVIDVLSNTSEKKMLTMVPCVPSHSAWCQTLIVKEDSEKRFFSCTPWSCSVTVRFWISCDLKVSQIMLLILKTFIAYSFLNIIVKQTWVWTLHSLTDPRQDTEPSNLLSVSQAGKSEQRQLFHGVAERIKWDDVGKILCHKVH